MKLILENVRTFVGRHEIPIKPLTLITGANSAGKSSLLAMFAAVCDRDYPFSPDFNNPSYSLGNFETIASLRTGRRGRARHFSVGFEETQSIKRRALSTYVRGIEGIQLSAFTFKSGDLEFELTIEHFSPQQLEGKYRLRSNFFVRDSTFSVPLNSLESESPILRILLHSSSEIYPQNASRLEIRQAQSFLRAAESLSSIRPTAAISIGPMRPRPERAYSETMGGSPTKRRDTAFPLAGMLREPYEAKNLAHMLNEFGSESGLFEKVGTKALGKKGEKAIEIVITLAKKTFNLTDVGYGVGQVLPLVAQMALEFSSNTFLIQQPEQHLHPEAQAALGSYFSRIVKRRRRRLIVETHSDFIIDRVRQEVALGRIPSDSVEIIYVERRGLRSTPYVIELDETGNLLKVPPRYREFFLREEISLLKRGYKV
jgi:hypothetical protein